MPTQKAPEPSALLEADGVLTDHILELRDSACERPDCVEVDWLQALRTSEADGEVTFSTTHGDPQAESTLTIRVTLAR